MSDAGFLCDTGAVLGYAIKKTPALQYRDRLYSQHGGYDDNSF